MDPLRYEIKFLGRSSDCDSINTWIKSSSLPLKKKYPDRWINNIYFDNHLYESFLDNASGISQRKKVRYRWYGTENTPQPGFLEVKHKRNDLGYKNCYKVLDPIYKENYKWRDITSSIKSQLNNEAQFFLNEYCNPVLINRYHREYYESHDGRIRITIDQKQAFYSQRSLLKPNFSSKNELDHFAIVELKCNEHDKYLASEFIKTFPLRRSRYSKYIDGVLHMI